ncbi:ABC-F family ATP-binding cassette domain-containing protein [Candidatus Woesebacteria bacterium]|nr:ABC-F family ATP-binding cassette domain-containing protein [Candidatus Woesebacteria bacterium]
MPGETIINFTNVTFEYGLHREILDEVNFSVRSGMKVAVMGQNGAGKSTIFKLITGALKPLAGTVSVKHELTVATAHQVITPEERELTVEAFFNRVCKEDSHILRKRMAEALNAVNLVAPSDKKVNDFSGGQQARLLLAAALIQKPDVLLLDEPTNNLDSAGIGHLMVFLMMYQKTVLVISHDADFLNTFTDGVLYLDNFTRKVEQYSGNYYDVVEQIKQRIERENSQNARMAKEIQENKEKINFFAHKGGKMRLVARKMREKVEQYESEKVDVRKEDKPIRKFQIPVQADLPSTIMTIDSFTIMKDHKEVTKPAKILLGKNEHLQIVGPNGIGKTTLIESMATGTAVGAKISPGVRVGYYRQDFSTLNYAHTVHESLLEAMLAGDGSGSEEYLRSVASGFLLTSRIINSEIHSISEGQKGLVCFARLVLQRPGLLILDEPTNHINFRHLPIIAEALSQYEGTMILVSHVEDFVAKIRIDATLDLEK